MQARRLTATLLIAVVTVAVSALAILSDLELAITAGGFFPARLSGAIDLAGALPVWMTPWSSALLHGSWVHLGVNMLMLGIAGTQVERIIGGSSLVLAYVAGALVAALAQFAWDPSSPIPMVGASGAISALFGLYALFFGRPKQVASNPRLNRAIHVLWLLVAWVALQWMSAMLAGGEGIMLATPAHIGGFIAGLALQRPLLLWRYRKA